MKKLLYASLISVLLGCALYALEPENYRLTNKQMLSDYDAMWAAMRESYPFWGVLSRNHPNEPDYCASVISRYREKLSRAGSSSDASMIEFLSDVAYSLYETCGSTGHVSIINPDYFRGLGVYEKYLDEMPEVRPWVTAIDRPEVVSFYGYYDYLIASMAESNRADTDDGEQTAESSEGTDTSRDAGRENLTTKILKAGKTAYIRVDSFVDSFIAGDLPKIRTFLSETKDYRNLIIDIRDNGGGNTDYWENAFVKPNISAPVSSRLIRLMKDTELTRNFYGPQYEGTTLRTESIFSDTKYHALSKADANGLTRARAIINVTQPENREKLFQGKIWVLIGPNVYSSAEAFAVFCKDTGFATLVGNTTGGSDSGGPILFELPSSHLLVQFDVEYCLNTDGSCNQETGTAPDIESDDALNTVLALIDGR